MPYTGPLAAFATIGKAEAVARRKLAFSEAKLLFNGLDRPPETTSLRPSLSCRKRIDT
jgi:hypothetical protein